MTTIALWICVCADDWAAELAVKASNVLVQKSKLTPLTSFRYEDLFLETLHAAGYTSVDDPCFVQCFGFESLAYMRNHTALPCVMLRREDGRNITDTDLDMYQRNGFQGLGPSKVNTFTAFTLKLGEFIDPRNGRYFF